MTSQDPALMIDEIELDLKDEFEESRFNVKLPESGLDCSRFAWSLQKAGSSLLTRMLLQASKAEGLPACNIPAQLFNAGLPGNAIAQSGYDKLFVRAKSFYVGWRNAAPLIDSTYDFSDARHVMLLRDPRDRLCSWFHSVAKSHAIPDFGPMNETMTRRRSDALQFADVNEWIDGKCFVLDYVESEVQRLHNLLPPDRTRVYRYEDVIFRKREFLQDMFEFLELPFDPERLAVIAEKNDIRPKKADVNKHIRRVSFGGYREEMTPKTQAKIGALCRKQIDAYGWDEPEKFGNNIVYRYEGDDVRKLFEH